METVRTCQPGEPPGRPPFDWLLSPRNRRSALRSVEMAIRRGWFHQSTPEHRAALMAALVKLLDSGELPTRQALRVCRVLLAMDRDDQLLDMEELGLKVRRPQSPRFGGG